MCCKCIVLILCLYGYDQHLNDKIKPRTPPPLIKKKKKLIIISCVIIHQTTFGHIRIEDEGGGRGCLFQPLSFQEGFRLSLNYYPYICQLMDFADRNSLY